MELMRLVITGTPGAGKSAFVRIASDIEVVDTDRRATDATADLKNRTTVAFDFGRVTINPDLELYVYGTPGQSRFDFMWDILIQRARAYMLLVAAHCPNDLPQALKILAFMSQRAKIPVVIGITHTDCPGAYSPEEILIRLGFTDERQCPPVVVVDATNRISVKAALNTLLLTLLLTDRNRLTEIPVPTMTPAYSRLQQQVASMGKPQQQVALMGKSQQQVASVGISAPVSRTVYEKPRRPVELPPSYWELFY
jgi:signal recognition particle receptor subunit beta